MRGPYTLGKPVVAVAAGAAGTTLLPSGALIEVHHFPRPAMVQVRWQQRDFLVHLPDLLAACRVEDMAEITLQDVLRDSSGEAG